jgi:hypothetical protein
MGESEMIPAIDSGPISEALLCLKQSTKGPPPNDASYVNSDQGVRPPACGVIRRAQDCPGR